MTNAAFIGHGIKPVQLVFSKRCDRVFQCRIVKAGAGRPGINNAASSKCIQLNRLVPRSDRVPPCKGFVVINRKRSDNGILTTVDRGGQQGKRAIAFCVVIF